MDFEQDCIEARKLAFSFKDPLIVHHYDCDGITSGSIVISAISKNSKPPRFKCIKKLDDNSFEELKNEKEIIFVDLGSGNERVNELKDVLIIDHHQPKNISKTQINPLLYGIDGGFDLSASGTAYSIFKTKIDLAIVGAIGDMQYPLIGKNREILNEGIKQGEIEVISDLRFYGRSTRPLAQFLAFSDEIIIPGLSFNESSCQNFLEDTGINLKENEKWRTYIDLGENEKEKLKKSLFNLLISKGLEYRAKDLIGEIYLLKNRPLRSDLYDASEFSTILNACGRHNKPEIGVGVCLGLEGSYEKSLELLAYHKNTIREGILYSKNNILDLGNFLFIDAIGAVDEGIIGIVCGMVLSSYGKKPIFGAAQGEKNTIKISARANKSLVKAGINLGKIISDACLETGGSGGGHKIAAGASIPKDKLPQFLIKINEFVSHLP
ncbi:MAG: DHH family phosphoesterase [Candidatus Micrarchaeia archaeon]